MERVEDLRRVYLTAVYRALDEPTGAWHAFTFDPDAPPGTPGDDAARLPFRQPWAIVTAWNPRSGRVSDAENAAAHARLVDAVRSLKLPFHPAEGHDPEDPRAWREEGLLIEGLEWKPAVHLLQVFRQHAAVYAASGRVGLLFADPDRWEVAPLRILGANEQGR